MRFRLVFQKRVRDQLADVWLDAPDRNAVTAASARMEQLLRTDPLHVGMARKGTDRVLFVEPIVIHYRVILDDYKVVLLDIAHV